MYEQTIDTKTVERLVASLDITPIPGPHYPIQYNEVVIYYTDEQQPGRIFSSLAWELPYKHQMDMETVLE